MIRIWLLGFGLFCVATSGLTQKYSEPANESAGKFDVQGATLIYDSGNATGDAETQIERPDVTELRRHLLQNSNINTLQLTSRGGFVGPAEDMAKIVMDFGLNTRAEGQCSSSCVTIFLAGDRREMTGGTQIGFHQNSWSEDAAQSYFKQNRQDEDWQDHVDFAVWIYGNTQHSTAEALQYMIERGVDPMFALETKKERSSMWYPTRVQLEHAGVLRD